MTECIHGLDEELCDVCAPRQTIQVQDPVPPARKATPARRAPVRAPGAKRAPAATDPLPDIDLATMRVHHWTHLSNLEGILSAGIIRSDASPELDVSSADAREKRAAVTLPDGSTAAEHVPFALSPDAATWDEVRKGAEGDRWSAAARGTRPTDFVILVAPVSALGDSFVVADGDATAPLTRFAAGLSEGGPLVRRASLADPELLGVEILVPGSFDLDALTLIGVPNDRVRDQVKALVKQAGGVVPRVAIYPPWFRPSED
ncbi:DarT ssDNA thymidine ADP-ribosyltransferase family protein [Frondihabitans peucedani]|uniref:DarT domain-containing protein n=1 Tax=Frondihabitans peucedani TaxID=598626 RepID=A0ABP8E2E0_9MICO